MKIIVESNIKNSCTFETDAVELDFEVIDGLIGCFIALGYHPHTVYGNIGEHCESMIESMEDRND